MHFWSRAFIGAAVVLGTLTGLRAQDEAERTDTGGRTPALETPRTEEAPSADETPGTEPSIMGDYPEAEFAAPETPSAAPESSTVRAVKLSGALSPTRLAPLREVREMLPPSQPFYNRYGVRGRMIESRPVSPLRWGDATFFPTAGSSILYSDDVVAGRTDMRVTTEAGGSLVYRPIREITLDAGWNSAWNDYAENAAPDYWNHQGTLRLSYNNAGVRGLSFSLYNLFSQTGNAGVLERELAFVLPETVFQSFGVRETFVPFERVINNVSGMSARCRTSQIAMETRYEYSLTDYDTRNASANDHALHNVSTSLAFTQFRGFTPFVSYTYDRIVSAHSALDESDENKVIVGTRNTVNRRLNAGLNVTGRQIQNLETPACTRDVVFNGDADYSFFRIFRLGVSASAGEEETRTDARTRLLGGGINLTVRMRRDLTSYTYASFRQLKPGDGATDTLIYGTRLDYRLRRQLSIFANFDRNDTWEGGSHRPLTTAGFGLSARF